MACGSWCVYYTSRYTTSKEHCVYCEEYINNKSHFELGKVDIFELAKGLKNKKEQERRKAIPNISTCPYCQEKSLFYDSIHDRFECLNAKKPCPKYKNPILTNTSDYKSIIQHLGENDKKDSTSVKNLDNQISNTAKDTEDYTLSVCPRCDEVSLFLNKHNRITVCLNKKCVSNNPIPQYHPKQSLVREIKSASPDAPELSNPMLLGVKMFLADVIYIVNRKYEEGHVCADFAQEVCQAATERGSRCGYVVISFENSSIGHAIVAFKTDHGLKFFEPQNANEVDVIIGRHYFAQAKGASEDNIISKVEIKWNDGAITEIE